MIQNHFLRKSTIAGLKFIEINSWRFDFAYYKFTYLENILYIWTYFM